MACHGLVDPLRLDELHQAQLDRFVAVLLRGAPLHHHAGTGLQHRAGHGGAVVGEDLRHPQLDSDNAVNHSQFLCRPPEFRVSQFPASSRSIHNCGFGITEPYFPPCSPNALISTSTPGGRSSFISASTVSRRGLQDINQPLVRADLKLLPRFLVHVRRTQHRPAIRGRRQRNRAGHLGAGALRRVHNLRAWTGPGRGDRRPSSESEFVLPHRQ